MVCWFEKWAPEIKKKFWILITIFFFKENFECSSYIVVNLLKLVASPKLTLNSCELANSLFIWKILGLQKITQFCATIHHMTNYDWWRCVSTWPTYTCHNSPCDELWHKIVPFFFCRSTIRFIFTLITVLSPHCLSLSRATFLYDKEGKYFTAVSLSLSLTLFLFVLPWFLLYRKSSGLCTFVTPNSF